jgi:drug/metabolite transporter (DMT)-like permease
MAQFLPSIALVVAAILYGFAIPTSKMLLNPLTPIQLTAIFELGTLLAVTPFVFYQPTFLLPWQWIGRYRWRAIGATVFGEVFRPMLLFFALRLAPAISVCLWLNLEVVVIAIVGTVFFRQRLRKRVFLALSVPVVGAIALAIMGKEQLFSMSIAAILTMLACLCGGVSSYLSALVRDVKPMELLFWKSAGGSIISVAIAIALKALPVSKTAHSTAWVAIGIGCLLFGVSSLLYAYASRRLSRDIAAAALLLVPFIGWLVSIFLLRENASPTQVIVGTTTLISLWFWWGENYE